MNERNRSNSQNDFIIKRKENTMTLYHELCRVYPSKVVRETKDMFANERYTILQSLYHSDITKPINSTHINKFHGHLARQRKYDHEQNINRTASHRKVERDILINAESISKVVGEIGRLTLNGQNVPSSLYKQLDSSYTSNSMKSADIKSQKPIVNEITPHVSVPQNVSLKPKALLSHNKWTHDEINSLSTIFYSVSIPKANDSEHWRLYYTSCYRRFSVNFPGRERSEVIGKLRQMISTKQFKQPGEIEYWQNMTKK